MPRRFQFSLKRLILLAVFVCLWLGGWHLRNNVRRFIEAEPAFVGRPIRIRGQYFEYNGPTLRDFIVIADGPLHSNVRPRIWSSDVVARRLGSGTYNLETSLEHARLPGVYRLRLYPIWPDGPPVSTTINVLP
jgi:hypothetical protein